MRCDVARFLFLAAAAACAAPAPRPEITGRVERVDVGRLRAHVLALDAIGPRPVGDAEATRATLDYLGACLREMGYEVREERFELVRSMRLVAVVRPLGDLDAAPSEREVSPDLLSAGNESRRAVTARLADEGWKVEGYRGVPLEEPVVVSAANLFATRCGADEPASVVELGAHYDTVPGSPGANDNSSGVAALLEVARVVADTPTRRTVRFCFFGAEEARKVGSERHVEGLTQEPGVELYAMINLDSVAYTRRGPGSQAEPAGVPWYLSLPDDGDFVIVVGESSSAWLGNLYEDAIDAYAPELPYYSANRIGARFPDAHRGDHAWYWYAGLAAIAVSDTGELRAPTYHTPEDTPDTLDFDFLTAVTRATVGALLEAAELAVGAAR